MRCFKTHQPKDVVDDSDTLSPRTLLLCTSTSTFNTPQTTQARRAHTLSSTQGGSSWHADVCWHAGAGVGSNCRAGRPRLHHAGTVLGLAATVFARPGAAHAAQHFPEASDAWRPHRLGTTPKPCMNLSTVVNFYTSVCCTPSSCTMELSFIDPRIRWKNLRSVITYIHVQVFICIIDNHQSKDSASYISSCGTRPCCTHVPTSTPHSPTGCGGMPAHSADHSVDRGCLTSAM